MDYEGRIFFILEREKFHELIPALQKSGYQVIGPTVDNEVVVYQELESADDLPIGWTDEQDNGKYRLVPASEDAFFGYTIGPQSWKRFLHPPEITLWQAHRDNGGFVVNPEAAKARPMAFVGVRACELHAIAIQDRVFLEGPYQDPIYQARREKLFVVAVNCGHAGGTCFCASLNTGPEVPAGFDLALTEVIDEKRHYFVGQVGTEKGQAILEQLTYREATPEELEAAKHVSEATRQQMGRTLDANRVKQLLYASYESARWDSVAERCLTCGNCTMVCPTCFCTTVQDVTDLSGEQAERQRVWDSCFTMDFSYIHGGSVRYSSKARYRQWLTHKMATWVDQFGEMGCVGCGRCITWCPVGIDITAEVRAIRDGQHEAQEEGSVTHEGDRDPAG